MAEENAMISVDWLKQQSQEMCIIIAVRVALRVLPFVTRREKPGPQDARLSLVVMRTILISAVAAKMPEFNFRAAASNSATAAQNLAQFTDQERGAIGVCGAGDAARVAVRSGFTVTDTTGFARTALSAVFAHDEENEYRVGYSDTQKNFNALFQSPIWSEPAEPDWLVSKLGNRVDHLNSGSEWSFWREWYQGFLDGKPLDWELQKEIALIPDADWEKGPEWIAGLIEEIRREFDKPKLDADQLTEQAKRLAAFPKTTGIIATSTADTIEEAIRAFMLAESLNELPGSLAGLHRLPPLLRSMGENAQSSEKIAQLEEQIAALAGEVARLTTELERAKASGLGKLAKETAVKTTVQLATAGFWSIVVGGVAHMTGIVDVGTLLERLSAVGSAPPTIEQLVPPQIRPPVDV